MLKNAMSSREDFENALTASFSTPFVKLPATASLDPFCARLKDICDSYVLTGISAFGFVVSLLCTISLYQLLWPSSSGSSSSNNNNNNNNNNNRSSNNSSVGGYVKSRLMLVYFLYKSVAETAYLLFRALNPLLESDSSLNPDAYVVKVLSIVGGKYLRSSFLLCSVFFDILAQLVCLSHMSRTACAACLNRSCLLRDKLVLLLVTAFSFSVYTYRLFAYNVVRSSPPSPPPPLPPPHSANGDVVAVHYKIHKNNFYHSFAFKSLNMFGVVVRDILCMLLIFAINVLICLTYRAVMANKRRLINGGLVSGRSSAVAPPESVPLSVDSRRHPSHPSNAHGANDNENDEAAFASSRERRHRLSHSMRVGQMERQQIVMVLLIGFSQTVLRLPTFLREFGAANWRLHINHCFRAVCFVLYNLSIVINILLLCRFNKLVRKRMRQLVCRRLALR